MMSRVTLVRYATKPERADENEALSRAVFEELKTVRPEGVAYALFRDGVNFVHLFVNFEGDEAAALTELPSFKAFSQGSSERFEAPADQLRITTKLVTAYGFERAHAPA
jgi:hypothetical protein